MSVKKTFRIHEVSDNQLEEIADCLKKQPGLENITPSALLRATISSGLFILGKTLIEENKALIFDNDRTIRDKGICNMEDITKVILMGT